MIQTSSNQQHQIVADVAGAIGGGAARLLREFKKYLSSTDKQVDLIGEGRRLTPTWLVQRELTAPSAGLRLSLNNAGFMSPFGNNVTLLRNILHFASKSDFEYLGFQPSRELRIQIPVIRLLARNSKSLVVPCTRMGEQVAKISPDLADRLVVRFHPVTSPDWAGEPPENPRDVLVPIVPQPYKNLDKHLPEFLAASESKDGLPIRLVVPANPGSIPSLASHPRVFFIGPQTSVDLEAWWRACGAVFFPVEFESFGYALAESRVYGRSIIARDTDQNREIAGAALHPYKKNDPTSLRDAIRNAISCVPESDSAPFAPNSYFDWLLSGASNVDRSTT